MGTLSPKHTVDLLVQTSTVELFHDYGVATAPVGASEDPPRLALSADRSVGVVEFSTKSRRGALSLAIPSSIVEATRGGTEHTQPAELDWVRELTSQLMGRLKTRLARYRLLVTSGLPTATRATPNANRSAGADPQRHFSFRTLHGEIHVAVTMCSEFDTLEFDCPAEEANEGDMILF